MPPIFSKLLLVMVLTGSMMISGMAAVDSQAVGATTQTESLSPIWNGATVYDGGWIYSDW